MDSGADRRLCVLFHESEILGAGISILRALDELRSHGWTSSGWFPGAGPLADRAATVLAAEGAHEKPIAFSRRGWRTAPGLVARVRRTPIYLRAFDRWLTANPPDVVHANSVLMLPEATIARARGFPIVVQIHELLPSGRKRDLSLRWAAAIADLLVGVSQPVSTMLRQCAPRTPVLTIHNGVPTANLTRTRPAHDGEFVVGSIGHISRTKGTDIFLEAARLALAARPELRFEHVGPGRLWGDDAFDARVEALAAAPGLREAVRMRGRQSGPEALCRWSVFVLSSRQDAFPLSTLEAMAAGVPVIACAVGGIPEQIEHLKSGVLVAPDDPAVISEWIVRLYDDHDLRTQLSARARHRVHEAFPVRAQADALERSYRHAIERRHRDRPGFPAPRLTSITLNR
jgi:glycosyltransferase involved in cell wall biosynthesis